MSETTHISERKPLTRNGDIFSNYGTATGSDGLQRLSKLCYFAAFCLRKQYILCEEVYWFRNTSEKKLHSDRMKRIMTEIRAGKCTGEENKDEKHMTNEFFKRKYTDIQMVYYVHFSKRIGYGVAVVATIPYPEKWVRQMLPHLVGSVEPMYHRCDQDGLKDKYQKLISGIFSSYRVHYEDIEYLENNNSPVPAQLKPLENVSQTGSQQVRNLTRLTGRNWKWILFASLAVIFIGIIAWLVSTKSS